jgi:Flp pilus assembly protein TadD
MTLELTELSRVGRHTATVACPGRKVVITLLSLTLSVVGCATPRSPYFSRKPENGTSNTGSAAEASASLASSLRAPLQTVSSVVASSTSRTRNSLVALFHSAPEENDESTVPGFIRTPRSPGEERAALVAQAETLAALGQQAEALALCAQVLETEPQHVRALRCAAWLHSQQGDFASAIAYLQRAIEVPPPDAALYSDLGLAFQLTSNLQSAREAFATATRLAPSKVSYSESYAATLTALGQSDEALTELLRLHTPAVAHYYLAGNLLIQADTLGASRHLEMALQADPSLREARLLQALLPDRAQTLQSNAYKTASLPEIAPF